MADDTEAELRARFDVTEQAFAHGAWRVDLILPRAADALIDEADFEADERLPYWADLWPSARGLARHLLDHPPTLRAPVDSVDRDASADRRNSVDEADRDESADVKSPVDREDSVERKGSVDRDDSVDAMQSTDSVDSDASSMAGRRTRALELGCGVALPSLALRSMGLHVLATDWYDDALAFARANAARNGLAPLRTAMLDWRRPPRSWWYDLVVAADVLYELRNAALLAALLPRVTAPGGTVLVADPGRVYAADFVRMMRAARWSVREIDVRAEPSAPGAESRVRILRLRREADERASDEPR